MNKHANIFIITTIVFAVAAIASLIGLLSATSEVDKYKTQTDAIVNEAVTSAKVAQKEEDTGYFFEEAKKPFAEYAGPADFGSIRFSYPKTWSVYNDQFDQNGYSVVFHPGIVPLVNPETAMSLRVSVVNKAYETLVTGYEKQITEGLLTAVVADVARTEDFAGYEGIRFNGTINAKLTGSIVLLKLRDKTIQIQVDAADWFEDFENIILPSFRYIP